MNNCQPLPTSVSIFEFFEKVSEWSDEIDFIKLLRTAILRGNAVILRVLLEHSKKWKIDLNKTDSLGNTLVHLASRKGTFDILKVIFEMRNLGFDLNLNAKNAAGETPFIYFCCENGPDFAKKVGIFFRNAEVVDLNAKGPGGNTGFHFAAMNGRHLADVAVAYEPSKEDIRRQGVRMMFPKVDWDAKNDDGKTADDLYDDYLTRRGRKRANKEKGTDARPKMILLMPKSPKSQPSKSYVNLAD